LSFSSCFRERTRMASALDRRSTISDTWWELLGTTVYIRNMFLDVSCAFAIVLQNCHWEMLPRSSKLWTLLESRHLLCRSGLPWTLTHPSKLRRASLPRLACSKHPCTNKQIQTVHVRVIILYILYNHFSFWSPLVKLVASEPRQHGTNWNNLLL
jgi:hypothetical protein